MKLRLYFYVGTALFPLLVGISCNNHLNKEKDKSKINAKNIEITTICKIGKTKIVNADDSRYTGLREPNAIMTSSGTLVVVFGPHDIDAQNDRAHQDLLCRTSNDNGRSWNDAYRIMDAGMESILPTTLIYDEIENKILLLVNVIFNAPERNDPLGVNTPCKHFVLTSTDEGKTWSSPEPILTDIKGITVFGGGNGIQLKKGKNKGRLLVPGGVGPNGANQGVFISDDHGTSWNFVPREKMKGNTEATCCEANDGKIIFSWRKQKSAFGPTISFSNDGGMTISESKETLPDVWAGCNNSLLSINSGDESAILYVGPLGPDNAVKYELEQQATNVKSGTADFYTTARSNGGAFISKDKGKSWHGTCIAKGWSFGYNVCVQFPDGDLGVIFEGIPPDTKNVTNNGWDKKKLGIYLAKFDPKILF
jgi:sialidase-1